MDVYQIRINISKLLDDHSHPKFLQEKTFSKIGFESQKIDIFKFSLISEWLFEFFFKLFKFLECQHVIVGIPSIDLGFD